MVEVHLSDHLKRPAVETDGGEENLYSFGSMRINSVSADVTGSGASRNTRMIV